MNSWQCSNRSSRNIISTSIAFLEIICCTYPKAYVNNVSSMNQSEIESFYNIVQGNEEGVKSYVAISDGYVERNVTFKEVYTKFVRST